MTLHNHDPVYRHTKSEEPGSLVPGHFKRTLVEMHLKSGSQTNLLNIHTSYMTIHDHDHTSVKYLFIELLTQLKMLIVKGDHTLRAK